jgi:hypothetical protein
MTVSGCNACNIVRHTSTYLENRIENGRSAGDTCGRFTEGLSIASRWRSAKFSSVNWRRDYNKELKKAAMWKKIGIFAILYPLPKIVKKFNTIVFAGGAPFGSY